MQKERPIIFSGPMVRAILDGRKTQTRRIVKHVPALGSPDDWCHKVDRAQFEEEIGNYRRFCPYGTPGDRLWVREAWCPGGNQSVYLKADVDLPDDPRVWMHDRQPPYGGTWRPSIHMPRWASRITLEITGIRVERLQEISEQDARAEGVQPRNAGQDEAGPIKTYRTGFVHVWQEINGKRANWTSNPWVWVVEFRRTEE
jgi:hypothetical protein